MKMVLFKFFVIVYLLFSFPAHSAVVPDDLLDFIKNREKFLDSLVVPVAKCVTRKDTKHAVFHGCIDWHSSVHGIWALTAYTRLTGNKQYLNIIKNKLNSDLLEQEHKLIRENPRFEMPYGRAWFLRLAMDHKLLFPNSTLLDEMSMTIADSLIDFYSERKINPDSSSYSSDSWALINLLEYGKFKQDSKYSDFVKNAISGYLIEDHFDVCNSWEEDIKRIGFMPTCTNWAWLILESGQQKDQISWATKYIPEPQKITPITEHQSNHHYGLNFSRSWGLWQLYDHTADLIYLEKFLDHFYTQFNNEVWWQGDYRKAHWVPQFGIFSVYQTYVYPNL